jgi:hypothetical protein
MLLIIFLSLVIVVGVIALVYLFNESKLQPDSPTIAAMEAHTEALEAKRRAEMEYDEEPPAAPQPQVEGFGPPETEDSDSYAPYEDEADMDLPPLVELSDYEYRKMLEDGGGNYVLPQWIANFFSSSDVCHTLDQSDNVVLIVKMTDPNSVETGIFDVSVDCDMTTQTVALKLHIGEGAAAEDFKTKFYLFERGDLFELGRLVRQDQVRVDILTRGSDYTLDYACTIRITLPPTILTQLRNVLANASV